MIPAPEIITQKLKSLASGDAAAFNELFPYVYQQLRQVARRVRWQSYGLDTLNTTALVHEAYLKMVDQTAINVQNRAHFFHIAARAMRQVLINYSQHHSALKRGGSQADIPLDKLDFAIPLTDQMVDELLSLDTVLQQLEQLNERQAQVVECRFFGGMSIEETAQALDTSPATVKRDWNFARAWLYRQMKADRQ